MLNYWVQRRKYRFETGQLVPFRVWLQELKLYWHLTR